MRDISSSSGSNYTCQSYGKSAKHPTLIKQQPWRRQGLATTEQWWLLGRTQIRIVLKTTLSHGFSIFIYNKKQLSTSEVLQLYSVDPVITEGLISSIFVLSSQVYLIILFCPLLPWYIGCSNIGNRDTGPSFIEIKSQGLSSRRLNCVLFDTVFPLTCNFFSLV